MTTSLARGHVASSHEHALLLAAQRGDRRAQEELLRRYEPLVGHIVRRLRLPCRCERADIAQEARIALLGAIRAWQPARGPFHSFAAHCVHTKTATALSTARTHKHQLLSRALSLDCTPPLTVSPTPVSDLASPTPAGAHGDPVSVLLVHEQLTALRAAWPTLTAKERAVLSGVLNGKSHRQLAIELACTAKTVGRALRRARRKLASQDVLAA
jgi:RNA polymerase sigma factor (sigma-70 family)